jgi:hypothetical protein
MPSLSAENGRQLVGDMAWIASQARIEPQVEAASLPPTKATSTSPEAMRAAPWAMAWPEEAQALEVANTGPWTWSAMARALAPALTITFGTVAGWIRGERWPKKRS